MGKKLKGKECGNGICQRKDGRYCARFVDRNGKRRYHYFKSLLEARNWLQMHSMRIGMELSLHPLI